MADLIKKIKIKKQDGTFTDYIPIGAEAQNISTNDGDSVQLKLNKKPYYYNSVADMKTDTKLKVGDMAVTLGYHSINDGGGAKYLISIPQKINNFDIEKYPLVDRLCYNNGEITWWTGYRGIREYFPVTPNTQYDFSNNLNKPIYYGLVFYDNKKNKIDYLKGGLVNFTTPSNCRYIRFAIQSAENPSWIKIEAMEQNNDGTIIELQNNNIAKILTSNLSPEHFGAYGDGIHDDSLAFENLIATSEVCYLMNNKNYSINNLYIDHNFTIYGNGSTLTNNQTSENFIEMSEAVRGKLTIENCTITAALSNKGIYIKHNTLLGTNIVVEKASDICIHVEKGTVNGSYGSCRLDHFRCRLSNIGIQLDATDCFLSNYVGYNCMTHLVNNGGLTHVNVFHGWNFNVNGVDWITGSALINTKADISGSDLYIDTLENGIVLPNGYQYTSIILQNVQYFLNLSSYPSSQQSPTLLKNWENFAGFCKIDGIFMNENNWKDSEGNYPLFIDGINNSRITLSNVSHSGMRFGHYKPITTRRDIQMSEIQVDNGTYLSFSTKKVKFENYKINIDMKGALNRALPTNTEIFKLTFISSDLSILDSYAIVNATFIPTDGTNPGYKLDAYMKDNTLYIYNHTGQLLDDGSVYINITYNKATQ